MSVAQQSVTTCRKCREVLEEGWTECPACKTATDAGALPTCPNCLRPVKTHWRQCPDCKTPLGGYATPTGTLSAGQAIAKRPAATTRPSIFVTGNEEGPPGEARRSVELPIAPNDILGEGYTIRGLLGAGGFGAVYRAYDAVTKEDIALKVVVVAKEEGQAELAIEEIRREFKLRQKINDVSHIIKSGNPLLCEFKRLPLVLLPMELAPGGSLRQWLARCRDIEGRRKEGLSLFRGACRGVKAIHDAGLTHLDVKPENILLADGKAKITDFGIGRYGGDGFQANPDQLLKQGVGTPQYMSPEQFRTAHQKNIGLASDIYSLGLILYEILDGALPFDGTAIELRDKHLNVAPAPLKGSAGDLWGVVERCLAKNPDQRYERVDALLKDLDRVEQGAAASVDVSCPKCRHINSNVEHKVCDECLAKLDGLFRPCPACAKEVRLDVVVPEKSLGSRY